MKIINLIENSSIANNIKCEHGLSVLIQTGQYNVLYDVGQSGKFIENANELGVDLTEVDYVVLSHGHYDHTGGLPAFLSINTKAKVLIHPGALKERFSRSSKMIKSNGVPWREEWEKFGDRIQFVDQTTQLFEGFWVVSGLVGEEQYASLDERLVYKDGDDYIKDPFADELVVVASDSEKVAMLTGCAHNGIVNILKSVERQLGFSHFRFIGGGLHLNAQPENKIETIIKQLSAFTVEQWGINHCTGELAVDMFEKAYPGGVMNFKGGEGYLI